ncbi:unnamed protein product [Aphanomyces euteiches]
MQLWSSLRYVVTGRTRTSDASRRTDSEIKTERTTSFVALFRIVLNVAAGTLVILPIITVVILLSQSMFERLVVSVNTQTSDYFWADYGKSCMLNANGWVPNTCDAATLAVVPDKIFAAIGVAFGQQWSREIAEAGGKLFVTTCVIGGTSDVGWTDLDFVAGYDYFPACVPDVPQDVAGMAMFETTARDEFTNIYYALMLYSDLDPAMTVYSHANSDGTFQDLITSPKRTLITLDDQLLEDPTEGLEDIIDSKALGSSQIAIDQGLTEWSQGTDKPPTAQVDAFVGNHSKHPVAPGWLCGHQVKNSSELIFLQFFFAAGTLVLLAGDVFITFEGMNERLPLNHAAGLRGVLQGKPVLTYTILSGLERRKLLLLFIVLNSMPGLLYADIARIYYFTTNGFKIWCLSIIMVANFFSFGLVLAVSLLDMIPLRLQHVVSYSAPVFLSASIAAISVACCKDSLFQYATNMFMRLQHISLSIGSYTAEGTPTSVKHIMNSIVQPLVVSFVCSLVLSTVYRLVAHKRYHDQARVFRNASQSFHGLGLVQDQQLLDASVVETNPESVASDKSNATSPHRVISIYALVASMLFPSFVQQYGTISNNEFTQKTKKKLEKKKYNHTRGACVV